MEICEVIHAPARLEAISRYQTLLVSCPARGKCGRAENQHVKAAGRGVVYPFCSEFADRMEGGKVALLGPDEGIGGAGTEVVDVFCKEGVGGRLSGKENELSAA